MVNKWNQGIETVNWVFYALMRSLIPGGVVLHFFGIPYGGATVAFSLVMVLFAYRRRKRVQTAETFLWLAAAAFVFWQFDLSGTRQWVIVILYGLWIFNQQQLETYLIPGAFGKSLAISLGLITLIVTATPMVGWKETAAFIRWSVPVYLLSAMLMMVRINLLMVYRQRDGHQINREKNLLFFNGISLVFFVVGGFFLFSAWLPSAWTSGVMAGLGQLIQWILYPLAVVLAKGSQLLKQLILLLKPDQFGQDPAAGGLPDENAVLESREALVPFLEWAGWVLLAGLLAVALFITLRKRRESMTAQEEMLQAEEKSFLSLEEIFQRRKAKAVPVQSGVQGEWVPKYRRLFARWLEQLRRNGVSIKPAMTPNQIGKQAVQTDWAKGAIRETIDTYNRVRYRGDDATEKEEIKLENIVRDLEENQNFQ